MSRVTRQKDAIEKKLRVTEVDRDGVVNEREKLRQMISNIEHEVQVLKKAADTEKRELDNCSREKEILNKNILRHQGK